MEQHGDPVSGCVVDFCTDTLCALVIADDACVAGDPTVQRYLPDAVWDE